MASESEWNHSTISYLIGVQWDDMAWKTLRGSLLQSIFLCLWQASVAEAVASAGETDEMYKG